MRSLREYSPEPPFSIGYGISDLEIAFIGKDDSRIVDERQFSVDNCGDSNLNITHSNGRMGNLPMARKTMKNAAH